MLCRQISVDMPWGFVKGQIFGNAENTLPILCFHGYLDNSNSLKPLAKYICQTNKYHMICIDLPGQGFSSALNNPLLYNIKTFIYSIRKIIVDLKLKDFIIMGHSFGCTLSLMYLACFPEEVSKIVLIDFVFDTINSNKELASTWNESISKYISFDDAPRKYNEELTYDLALEKIMKSNRFIDENAAKVLLERALVYENGKLDFSRDRNLPLLMPIKIHLSEFLTLKCDILKNIKAPILHIYAYPYAYGEMTFDLVKKILDDLNSNSTQVEQVKFDGTHHFHMLDPENASKIIVDFLDKKTPYLHSKI